MPPKAETDIRRRLEEYFAALRPGDLAAAFLFGSEARGEAGPRSDVDLGVIFRDPRPKDPLERVFRRGQLADDLEQELGRHVDVVDFEAVRPEIFQEMFRDAVLIYDADPERREAAVLRQDKFYHDEYWERRAREARTREFFRAGPRS